MHQNCLLHVTTFNIKIQGMNIVFPPLEQDFQTEDFLNHPSRNILHIGILSNFCSVVINHARYFLTQQYIIKNNTMFIARLLELPTGYNCAMNTCRNRQMHRLTNMITILHFCTDCMLAWFLTSPSSERTIWPQTNETYTFYVILLDTFSLTL